MCFVLQFTEATGIITLESVIFPMRFCVDIKKFIASSSNNIYYIQIHHFTQQTMLNQWLYYTIQYLELNTKSKGGGNHHPLLVADVTINSLVARRLINYYQILF